MKAKKCILCGQKFEGYGNNAQPLKEGRCCDGCNITKVIPGRVGRLQNEISKTET